MVCGEESDLPPKRFLHIGQRQKIKNAAAYAVTLLNLDKNREALAIFEKIDLAAAQPGVRLCAALAYARTGNIDKATAISIEYPVGKLGVNELALQARIAAVKEDAASATMPTP